MTTSKEVGMQNRDASLSYKTAPKAVCKCGLSGSLTHQMGCLSYRKFHLYSLMLLTLVMGTKREVSLDFSLLGIP